MEDLKQLTNNELDELYKKTYDAISLLEKEKKRRAISISEKNIGKYYFRKSDQFLECVKVLAYDNYYKSYMVTSICIYYEDFSGDVDLVEFVRNEFKDIDDGNFEEITKEQYEYHLEEAMKIAIDTCNSGVTYRG